MKIGIDARQLSHNKKHGLRTYVENLVKYISKIDKYNSYTIYVDNKDTFNLSFLTSNFHVKILPWKIRYFSTLLNDHFILPLNTIIDRIDIMHYPANPVNFYNPTPSVITVHDAIQFLPLKSYSFMEKLKIAIPRSYSALLIKISSKLTRAIITISSKSKQDLIKLVGLPGNKIRVTHEAANDNFRKIKYRDQVKNIRSKFNLGEKFVLGFAHKNGFRIVKAYSMLPEQLRSTYKLGLIWLKPSFPAEIEKEIASKKLEKSVICIPPVSEADLVLLYNAASLFVFPSFYEGFGLPVLEAMRCGCPVLCSNRGSIPEVAGSAALFVYELDNESTCVHEIADKMERILVNKALRRDLIHKGLENAMKFSWEKTATETLQIYKTAYNNDK